jgi:hypothetical protein
MSIGLRYFNSHHHLNQKTLKQHLQNQKLMMESTQNYFSLMD